MNRLEYYRRTILIAGITAVVLPFGFAVLCVLFGSVLGVFPWVTAAGVVGGLGGMVLFGLPTLIAALIFLRVAREWSERAHQIALILSPIFIAILLAGILLLGCACPPNTFPAREEIPAMLMRFIPLVVVPGYVFLLGSYLFLIWRGKNKTAPKRL